MIEHVGIEYLECGPDYLKARMPVDHRTVQTYGILHGGASAVLAETLGSVASVLIVDREKYLPVGLEINVNHLRPVRQGWVIGTARPIHVGKKTHVWDVRIHDESGKLVSVSRLTVMVVARAEIEPGR
ncbi:MAG: hotdog fold thioesterase [Calditrichaeota bacterium]|nr:MAG: hotdog fold thioesterase [Calditrichota bacterium]